MAGALPRSDAPSAVPPPAAQVHLELMMVVVIMTTVIIEVGTHKCALAYPRGQQHFSCHFCRVTGFLPIGFARASRHLRCQTIFAHIFAEASRPMR